MKQLFEKRFMDLGRFSELAGVMAVQKVITEKFSVIACNTWGVRMPTCFIRCIWSAG